MQAAFQADSGVTPGKLPAANAAGVAVPGVGDAAHASAVELNNRGIFSSAEKGTITLAVSDVTVRPTVLQREAYGLLGASL